MNVYLDTANLIAVIDGDVSASDLASLPNITWCISGTTLDDLVGQRLEQKLQIVALIGALQPRVLFFRPGYELLAIELGAFARKHLGLPAVARQPVAHIGAITLQDGPTTAARTAPPPTSGPEDNPRDERHPNPTAASLKEVIESHDEIDAEREWQKRQVAIAARMTKFAQQPSSQALKDAFAQAMETPDNIPELAMHYFDDARKVAEGSTVLTDDQLIAALADGRIEQFGMDPEMFVAASQQTRALLEGDASTYFSIAKRLSLLAKAQEHALEVASAIPKNDHHAWAFQVMLVSTPDDIRRSLLKDFSTTRKLSKAWLDASYAETPGAFVYREALYQFMRNTGHKPTPSTANDFYHLMALPHVDLMFVDNQTLEYVERAKSIPVDERFKLRLNSGFQSFITEQIRSSASHGGGVV